jgi:hypothetical protein
MIRRQAHEDGEEISENVKTVNILQLLFTHRFGDKAKTKHRPPYLADGA